MFQIPISVILKMWKVNLVSLLVILVISLHEELFILLTLFNNLADPELISQFGAESTRDKTNSNSLEHCNIIN